MEKKDLFSQAQAKQFTHNSWATITDKVTQETLFTISWVTSPNGKDTLPNKESIPFCKEEKLPSNVSNTSPSITAKHTNNCSNTTTLWAWPKDIELLAVGHVLLDCVQYEKNVLHKATVQQHQPQHYIVTLHNAETKQNITPPIWKAESLFQAMDVFIAAEGQWNSTGCFHRAGVFDIVNNKLLIRAEDIGRHNCIDRLAGWSILENIPLEDKALLVSARMTASLCAKALRAGFTIIVSRSAVTTAAIAMAQEAGATLVGFARTDEKRFTVFSDTSNYIYDR